MLKTFTFAILHFATAFLVVYALTGSFVIGGTVALIEPLCNTVVFYLHERAWLKFGKRKTERSTSYGHDVLLRHISNKSSSSTADK